MIALETDPAAAAAQSQLHGKRVSHDFPSLDAVC
jgi:hypothetical protein